MKGGIEVKKTKAIALALFAIITLALLEPSLGQDEKLPTQQKPNLPTIQKAVICEGVENRTPWGIRQLFPSNIDTLYCFTHLTNIPSEGNIHHIWYHGNVEIASVELSISPPQWRTWSTKIIPPELKGIWRVEVVYGDYVLKTLPFTIQ